MGGCVIFTGMTDDAGLLAAWAGLWTVVGLAVGSFLNVVVWRVPRRQSVRVPASYCPSCGTGIRARDNVPVVAWVRLRGRCRDCGARISLRYPLVELGSAALFAAAAVRFGVSWDLAAYALLFAALLAVTAIDLEHYIVPNRIVFPVAAASVVVLAAVAALDGKWGAFGRAAFGGAAAFSGMLVVHLIHPAGLGFGDVKLAFVLGLYLGWLGWDHVALGLFLGFLYGALVGAGLVLARIRTRRQHVPFAPFLAAGTVTAVLVGAPLLRWYGGL